MCARAERALGVTTEARSAVLPDVPTVAEQALPGYDASVFFGLVVAVATPAPAREAIRAATEAALNQPELRRWLEMQGMPIAPSTTPAALTALMAEETARRGAVVRETGARAD
ncbi:hypothetical protein EJV46_21050 [Roseococcus sp. SYP-B2431]|uniref:Bug family tripartite tricarboxylate transporter substrate binding protein n=1 Tax=Roseococcus sp. SYP-B2431 TaxID=2496640 RepID=UPI001038BE5B|nr:tripartite tricarboxylate transporter substrate-binding protein [Roseococcus sp. SYP-B2431]TCH96465.1 hypothetical protein EJV46_21050 [Roseococcus sp. SYP-B2431]